MSTTEETSVTERVHIRPAVAADAARVFVLLIQLDQGYAPDRVAFDSSFAALLAEEQSSVVLVAEDTSGLVLGYALVTITRLLHSNGSSAQLQELVVDSEHHGVGIGTALVEHVEQVCRDRDVRQLTVPSRRSAAFYERIGYRSTADFLKRTF